MRCDAGRQPAARHPARARRCARTHSHTPTKPGDWLAQTGTFFSKSLGNFLLGKSSFTEANFREILQNLGSRRPPPRTNLLARLRWGQAICRLAKLARLLIRGAGRGERARISGRIAELTLRGCRLSPNRRSLLFGLACSVLCVALSLMSRNKRLHQILHSDVLTDPPSSLGRQIFEDFRALRAQANFDSAPATVMAIRCHKGNVDYGTPWELEHE
jgi:hypothetical protein